LLFTIDQKQQKHRTGLVRVVKYVGGGIEDREQSIKKQLSGIAIAEMQKGAVEDLLFE
jgi:hypothetical protein